MGVRGGVSGVEGERLGLGPGTQVGRGLGRDRRLWRGLWGG